MGLQWQSFRHFPSERIHQANVRIAVNKDHFGVYNQQSRKISVKNEIGNHGYLRILHDENEVSFYYSTNGKDWVRVERTLYVAGFNHNVFGGFMSLRAGIVFDNFKYTKLMN